MTLNHTVAGPAAVDALLNLLDEAFEGRGIEESNSLLREHVEALTDDDLDTPRKTNWGELRPTQWIVAAIIGHDFYHAGEINHLRSLLGTDDRWRWQQFEDS